MNIWIVNHYAIPPSMGGLVRHYYFSKYLGKKGHNVKIFTSSKIHNTEINMIQDKSLYKEELMDGVEYTFVRSRDYKGNGLDRILNMIDFPFKVWKTMKAFFRQEKPDVIYTSSPDLFVAFFALLFGRKNKIPVVVEIRDLWPESIVEYKNFSKKNPIIQILYQLEKWIYKKSDRIIFTIPGGKDYLCDKGWNKVIDLDKVFHINNGVDLEEFEENKKKYAFADEDLDNPEVYKVIYMGSIRFANNIGQLVDAMEVLKEWGKSNIHLLIYGDGTEKELLEKRCQESGLHVKFKGKVEKKYVPYILSKADINVINVKNTGLNNYGCSWNKLFEYIASEKPILCNYPQNYDLIIQHELGINKTFVDKDEYAQGILDLLELTEEGKQEISVRMNQVKRCYDYKSLTEQLETVLGKDK